LSRRLGARSSLAFVRVVKVAISDYFFFILHWRRNHIPAAGPLSKINLSAAVAAKREVGGGTNDGFFANRAAKFEPARHKAIAEVRIQIEAVRLRE
jgi:hypothetical protein